MEVHAHSHTPRKKWTHYFWEFLMLFLAVFCGFLAENFREHQVEHNREKQFMQSMIEDLKADTASLSVNIRLRQRRGEMIDSLIYLLNSADMNKNGNSIYYYGRFISPPINFFPNDRTIQQLKNTGSLRLITNFQVSNSIMAYDRKMRQQIFEYTDEQQVRGEYRLIANKVFNGKVFYEMIRRNTIEKPVSNPQLFTSDASLINEYITETQYLRKVDQTQIIRSQELFAQAKELIALIQKEYHLK